TSPIASVPACRSTAYSTIARLILCSASLLRRCCLARKRFLQRCSFHQRRDFCLHLLCFEVRYASRFAVYWRVARSSRQVITTAVVPSVTLAGWISPRSTATTFVAGATFGCLPFSTTKCQE